jgi:hypothetical protein
MSIPSGRTNCCNLESLGRHDLSEKGDGLDTGVARCRLGQHFAGGRVQRGEQTQGAIVPVFRIASREAPWSRSRISCVPGQLKHADLGADDLLFLSRG